MLSLYRLKLLSGVQLFAAPWIVACQAPLSVGFSRQECWSGLPFPSLGESEAAQLCPTYKTNFTVHQAQMMKAALST